MKKGFTLLELIIVIVIVGVLAALAIPKLYAVVEGSRATEALSVIPTFRSALERCYLMNNGSYAGCYMHDTFGNTLGIEDPTLAPNSHFKYQVYAGTFGVDKKSYYYIQARRLSLDASPEHIGKCIHMGFNAELIFGANETCLGANIFIANRYYWNAADIYKPFLPKGN